MFFFLLLHYTSLTCINCRNCIPCFRFFESLAYTIGSAYFVTGSYPEEYVAQYVQAGNKVPPLTENTFASGKGSSNGCRSTIDLEADDCSVRDGEVEVSFAGEIIESSSDEPRVVSKRGWFGWLQGDTKIDQRTLLTSSAM